MTDLIVRGLPYHCDPERVKQLKASLRELLMSLIRNPDERDAAFVQFSQEFTQDEPLVISANLDWPFDDPVPSCVAAHVLGQLCNFANCESALKKCRVIKVSARGQDGRLGVQTDRRKDPAGKFEYYKK